MFDWDVLSFRMTTYSCPRNQIKRILQLGSASVYEFRLWPPHQVRGGGLLYNVGYLIHRSTQQWPVCRCRVVLQCCIAEDLPPAGLRCSSLRQSNNAIILIVANKLESVRCPGAGLPCQRRRRRGWWRANRLASDRLSKPLTPLNTPTGRLTAPGR